MPTCAIKGCHNGCGIKEKETLHADGSKPVLHKVPKSGLTKQWEENINRKNFNVNDKTVVCSLHFEPSAYIPDDENKDDFGRQRKRKTLKQRAFPTLHLKPKTTEVVTESVRSKRKKRDEGDEEVEIPKKSLKLSSLDNDFEPEVEPKVELEVEPEVEPEPECLVDDHPNKVVVTNAEIRHMQTEIPNEICKFHLLSKS